MKTIQSLCRQFRLPMMALLLAAATLTLTYCDENSEDPKNIPSISNLDYFPHMVSIRLYENKFSLSGTIDFNDQDGDLEYLRVTSSAGTDVTAEIEGTNGIMTGTVTGLFEFYYPSEPTTITFDVWVTDKKGHESNKLTGTVEVSVDDSGTQWLSIGLPITETLNKVYWGGSQFIILGNTGMILTSPNGRDWTERNSGISNSLQSAAWSGAQYIAVGQQGTILSSPNGISWTPRASGHTTDDLWSVASSGTRFVAVGSNTMEHKAEIFTSTDGIQWTTNAYSIPYGFIPNIIWTGNQFVAVGLIEGTKSLILTSPDGLTWTDRSIANGGYILWDVAANGNTLVAVGGAIAAQSTDNGVTWNSTSTIPTPGILSTVCYTGKKFMAGGYNGLYSTFDGITWTGGGGPSPTIKSISWSGVQYVALSNGIYTSP